MAATSTLRGTEPAALPVDPELLDELWRLEPHTFAAKASGGRFKVWPHVRLVGSTISDAVVGGGGREIVNMPPGLGKSSLLSKWTPTWFLDAFAHRKVILAAHGAELANEWGRAVRDEINTNSLIRTRLKDDSQAAHRWNTPQGGGMYAVGVGGGVTGFRANLILVDDPHPSWEEAQSATQRRRVQEWFTGTLLDRAEPGATVVLLMHRWHEDDLAGYLIENHPDRWHVIRLPALAEPGDVLGRREGAALCPQRYDEAHYRQERLDVGEAVWAAKFQQNPLAVGAGRVYFGYLPERNDDKSLRLRADLPLQVSFDFNYNPGMHAEVGQYDTAADVLTAVHEIHGPYMRLPACLDAFVNLIESLAGRGNFPWPSLEVFGDPAGHQNRAETTATAWQQVRSRLEQWMKSMRQPKAFHFKVPAGQYPVKTRVDTFNAALFDPAGQVHYRVHPDHCPRLREDFKRLKADEQGLVDKRDEKLSHASEAEANRVCWLRPIRKPRPAQGQVGFVRTV